VLRPDARGQYRPRRAVGGTGQCDALRRRLLPQDCRNGFIDDLDLAWVESPFD
jgi:hypothetical protein